MRVCGQNVCYHVAAYVILFKFDMQHDHVLKKLKVTFYPNPPQGRRRIGWSAGKIFGTMLLYFMIPFNLICNMTMF